VFYSYQAVKQIFNDTTTKTSLKVFVRINDKMYPNKLGITKQVIDKDWILFQLKLANSTIPYCPKSGSAYFFLLFLLRFQ